MRSHLYQDGLFTALFFLMIGQIPLETRANESLFTPTIDLEEIRIQSGIKNTQSEHATTSVTTTFSAFQLRTKRIESMKALSGFVPNLLIPDYGSRLSSAVYLRGIGSRGSGQTIGMYIDHVPIMDKSAFDTEFMDLQGIEVLRGPQGTLFGKNAMGGIIHLHSLSPFDFSGTKLSLSGGSHGYQKVHLAHYMQPLSGLGISNQAYYTRNDGYFTNLHTHKRADDAASFGAKSRVLYHPNARTRIQYSLQGERTLQEAFPYQRYNSEKDSLEGIHMNDASSYKRSFVMQSLYLEQQRKGLYWSSTTSHQFLQDHMQMDQDFSAAAIFTLEQRQKDHSLSQEWIIKAAPKQRVQWLFGLFGFYSRMKTHAPVTFKTDGMSSILQANIDKYVPDSIPYNNDVVPFRVLLEDSTLRIDGDYSSPNWGVALFHQSTLDHFLLKELSLTLGLRFEYENIRLNHLTKGAVPFGVWIDHASIGSFRTPVIIQGSEGCHTLEWLPKLGLHYVYRRNHGVYLSVNKGHKSGGYNFQLFSDMIQDEMKTSMMRVMPNAPTTPAPSISVGERIKYTPETSWNYELGWTLTHPENTYNLSANAFYMQIEAIQLMHFAPGGSGRMIRNAGNARSYGFEFSGKKQFTSTLSMDLSYGFNRAVFKNYRAQSKNSSGGIDTLDYTGNTIPYAPAHTLSLGGQYLRTFKNGIIDQLGLSCQYVGQGKIYWNEANSLAQAFYGTLNAKISLRKGAFRMDFWVQNATNTQYNCFYFESMGQHFFQAGKPIRSGIELNLQF